MASEQGAFDIYVRPVRWRRKPVASVDELAGRIRHGRKRTQELLYTADDQIMTVKYRLEGSMFSRSDRGRGRPCATPRPARRGSTSFIPTATRIVATPDTTGATKYDTIDFVFNFFDELRRLLPPGR